MIFALLCSLPARTFAGPPAPARPAAPPPPVSACEELVAQDPTTSSIPTELLERSLSDGYLKSDPDCLAYAAIQYAGQDECTIATNAANRAVQLAEGSPLPLLARGLARACTLSLNAAKQGQGEPVWCDRDALREAVFDLGRGALLSKMAAEAGVLILIETDLALRCRDDDGLLFETVRAIAATARVRSRTLDVLAEEKGIPWGLTGAALFIHFSKYLAAVTRGQVADAEVGGPSIVRAQARKWLLGSIRGNADPFSFFAPQVVARTLLQVDAELAESSLAPGFFFEDVDLIERTGGIDHELPLTAAAMLYPLWDTNAPLAEKTTSLLTSLSKRFERHADTRRGALLLLKARIVAILRTPDDDACAKAGALDEALSDFAHKGAIMNPQEQWGPLVARAAKEGVLAAKSCRTGVTMMVEFDRIMDDLKKDMNPWPRSHAAPTEVIGR